MIDRNPGVWLLWVTSDYRPMDHNVAAIKLGDPSRFEWWTHGARATEEDVRFVLNRAVDDVSSLKPGADVGALHAGAAQFLKGDFA